MCNQTVVALRCVGQTLSHSLHLTQSVSVLATSDQLFRETDVSLQHLAGRPGELPRWSSSHLIIGTACGLSQHEPVPGFLSWPGNQVRCVIFSIAEKIIPDRNEICAFFQLSLSAYLTEKYSCKKVFKIFIPLLQISYEKFLLCSKGLIQY